MRPLLVAAIALTVCPAPSLGAALAYTSESEFLAATTPTHTESFEDEAVTAHLPSQVTSYFTASVAALSGGSPGILIGDSPGWASDGMHYLGGCGGVHPCVITFALNFPVYAIGFDVMSASESPTQTGSQSVVMLELPSGQQFIMSSCPPCLSSPGFPGNADYFFGVVSDSPFASFSISNTAYADGVALDRMQLAAVPLPAAVWFLGGGLTALGWLRRKSTTRI